MQRATAITTGWGTNIVDTGGDTDGIAFLLGFIERRLGEASVNVEFVNYEPVDRNPLDCVSQSQMGIRFDILVDGKAI